MNGKTPTKEEIVAACEQSLSMSESARLLGIDYKTLRKYAKIYGVFFPNPAGKNTKRPQCGHSGYSMEDILAGKHPQYGSHHLRLRLIKEGYFKAICSSCGLSEWLGKVIPLQLDHIDGNPINHLLSNLRLLCPNCHAQTETYCGKNKR